MTETHVEQLLERALDLPADEREEFLGQACGSDASLRERLQRLLALALQDGGFLERSPLRVEAPLTDDVPAVVASGLAAGEMLGAYRVVGLIGRGGMGEVYRATRADGLFEKEVAVKVLRPDAVAHLDRFESERRILARLEHPGIARLLDGGVTCDGRPYMQMEFVPGASITDYCRVQRLSLEQRLDLLRQCGEAVAFAHAQGVVHRDLKPSNVLVTPEGQVKLLDFGVAKLLRPSGGSVLTITNAPLTPAYAAPEQLQGKTVSPATDIYAMGVVLYELLTGRTPWQDKPSVPVSTLLYRILNDTAPPASQAAREQIDSPVPAGLLTGDLDAILARSLRKNPAERYPTIADLLADLARYQKGEPITARTTPGETRLSHRDEAERRQLSVLFCDLVGSTQLSETLDPEAFREVLLTYQATAAEVIGRYEGHIAQRLGDGLLIYFGYPSAHDDDAERAVRCGYDLVAALTRLDYKPPLAGRIGIHTGTVVVGQIGGNAEILAKGATTNLAARLQALAEPDTVLISDATFRLVPGLFITKAVGTPGLKRLNKPVRVHQVIHPSGVRSRLEAADRLTPFVGREQEQALLLERWNEVGEGRGQAILLSAEPGMGKSRLLMVLRSRIQDSPHTWLECRASPLTRNSAYQPVVELLHRGLALREGDTPEQRLQRLEQGLDAVGFDKAETIPLLAPLLNLSPSERYPSSQLGPELKRKRTLETLSNWVLALARQQPLVIAFEDLHWTDASSLDLLGVLLEQIATVPVLLVMTTRPEFTSPWPARAHFASASLRPLRAAHAGQMLNSVAGDRPLPTPVHTTLLERAGGVPLFVEELTKAMLESGQLIERDNRLEIEGAIEQLSVPSTLQDSLMARLDRLGPGRDLIQTAAVIGGEIPYRLLELVADLDEPTLRQQLKQLTDAELLYLRGAPPQATYLFKHALIQDTAYDTLLKSTRQTMHRAIAAALEQHFKERADAEPEVLAEHFEKANQNERAVEYYKLAAEKAQAKTANREAINYAGQALKLLPTLTGDAAREQSELPFLLIQALSLATLHGYAHGEVRLVVERAEALLCDAQDLVTQMKTLGLLWMTNQFGGRFEMAIRFGERMVTLCQKMEMPIFESIGHTLKGLSLMSLGRFTDAEKSQAQALRHSDLASSKMIASQGGTDPTTHALVTSSEARWVLGYPDQALAKAEAARVQAKALEVPHNSCMAEAIGMGFVRLYRREPKQLMEASHIGVELCEKYGVHHHQVLATRSMGVALCMMGRVEEGLALIRHGIEALQATGALMNLPQSNGFLAEQCLAHGRLSEAHAALDEAFSRVEQQNNRYWEAELHRIKGELLLAENADDTTSAEACFHKALEVARGQEAKSLELRAATSLAQLWQKQGRPQEAREVLKPVYEWFTEGFDTPDLITAKALLGALA